MCARDGQKTQFDLGLPTSPRDQDSRDIFEAKHPEHVLFAPSLDRPVRVARPDPARVKLEPLPLGVAAQVALKLRRSGPLRYANSGPAGDRESVDLL